MFQGFVILPIVDEPILKSIVDLVTVLFFKYCKSYFCPTASAAVG
jgi:hypothetical protein